MRLQGRVHANGAFACTVFALNTHQASDAGAATCTSCVCQPVGVCVCVCVCVRACVSSSAHFRKCVLSLPSMLPTLQLFHTPGASATRLRFSRDARLAQVSSLLASSTPVSISLDVSELDPDLPLKQQQQVGSRAFLTACILGFSGTLVSISLEVFELDQDLSSGLKQQQQLVGGQAFPTACKPKGQAQNNKA
eukprot:1141696-Pelagomonas_calceolata.AAC.3